MLVDSHCHLDFPDFADDLDAIVGRAKDAGVGRMVTISTRVKKQGDLLAITERFPDVYCSVGTHPHYAHEELDISVDEIVRLEKMLCDEGVLLLKYWFHVSRKQQKKRLKSAGEDSHYPYGKFLKVCESFVRRTSTAEAPWIIVPGADACNGASAFGVSCSTGHGFGYWLALLASLVGLGLSAMQLRSSTVATA